MTLTRIAIGVAAAALMAGAAAAQIVTDPSTGETRDLNPGVPGSRSAAIQFELQDAEAAANAAAVARRADSQPMPMTSSTAYVAPATTTAPAASSAAADASVTVATATPMPSSTVTVTTTTNGPVPDTAANRARYGQPLSRAGKMTTPAGN